MKLLHGSRRQFVAHIGLCLTDDRRAARCYAGEGGRVTNVELDTRGLRVVRVEGFGEGETADACGDSAEELASLAEQGVDVVTYDDEAVGMDETHRTWRIVSEKALARVRAL